MIPEQVTPEQRQVLAQIGHLYLLLDSHQSAAEYCREQLQQMKLQLEQIKPSQEPS